MLAATAPCVTCRPFLPGPWTVTRSSLRRARRVIVVCPAVGAVRVASFVCAWGPVLGLLRLWRVLRGSSSVVLLTGPWTVPRLGG